MLVIVHVVTFHSHYDHTYIFPWDFVSSAYSSQTVGWFEDGSILSPPNYLPYSSMGFPAWWALQSGEWYLPLQLLRLLGYKYTFFVGSAFQSFHVLIGATGIYFFSRANRLSRQASAIAALVFHFSSIFYSNSEHIEFVRGAALLPWVLLFLHPAVILKNRLFIFVSALTLQQFLIAAYPGDVVVGFYLAAGLVLVWIIELRRSRSVYIYLASIGSAGLSGVLMSSIKWTIPISQMLGSFVGKPGVESIHLKHLLTLMFRYGTPNLPNDLTMQSLWSPPIFILLCVFARRTSKMLVIGVTIAIVSIALGSLENTIPVLRKVLPGLSLSRLAHSDWRVPLHISFALASAAIFDLLTETGAGKHVLSKNGFRCLLSILLIGGLTLTAVRAGYRIDDVVMDASAAAMLAVAVAMWATYGPERRNDRNAMLFVICTVFIAVTSYLQYVIYVPGTWLTPWSKQDEIARFGSTISSLIQRPRKTSWSRRPQRETYGVGDLKDPSNQISIKFNKAWYAQEFTAFGYDNLASLEYKRFLDVYENRPDGDDILQFVNHPSQAIVMSPGETPDVHVGATCPAQDDACWQGSASGTLHMEEYRLDGATYTLDLPNPMTMMENELYYPGFAAELCSQTECRSITPTAGEADLRTWAIPAGQWKMVVSYRPPFAMVSIACCLLGFGLALIASLGRWTTIETLRRGLYRPNVQSQA